jgi:hypothetical protein
MEIEHRLAAVFLFYADTVMGCVEAFLIDLSNVVKRDTDIVEQLVFESLDAHVVEGSVDVLRGEGHTALLCYADSPLNDGQGVDEQAVSRELFDSCGLHLFRFNCFPAAQQFVFENVQSCIRYFLAYYYLLLALLIEVDCK